MGISLKLALRYLKSNKRRTITTIIGVTIVTTLLIGILLLFQTYQNYMIGLVRNDENWEVRFNNISYEKVYGLKKNTDIKEISLVKDIGVSEEIDKGRYLFQEYIYLKAYSPTAMENLGVSTIEGRMPKEIGEIVISQNLIIDGESVILRIGDNIEFKINNKENKYKIVGIIKPPKFEEFTLNMQKIGAITYLDENSMSKDTIVEASINYKKLNQIYSKSRELAQVLQIEDTERNMEYNTELLHYSGIWNMTDKEDLKIIGIMLFLIILIIMIAITFIYSIFNISVLERKKEFANLNSIGATKEQIFIIIIKEATIILVISIFIGLLFSLLVQREIIKYTNNTVSTQIEEHIPYGKILIAILITTITTYVSVLRPAFKAKKSSTIMLLKGNSSKMKNHRKMRMKEGKKIEEKLAVRNTEYHKAKYTMLIFTTTISIFLFLTTQGYLKNIYHGVENIPDNYIVNVNRTELLDEIIREFNTTGVVESMSAYYEESMFTYIDDSKLSESLKTAVQESPELKRRIFATVDNEFWCKLIALPEKEYVSYLKQIGVKKLEDDECIIINYDNLKTKYYDGLYITNYEIGDTIEMYRHAKKEGYSQNRFNGNTNSLKDIEFIEYGDNQEKIKFNIAKIVDSLPKGMKSFSNNNEPIICIIVNYDTLFETSWKLSSIEIEKEENKVATTLSINARNRELLDEKLQQIATKHQMNQYDLAWTSYIDNANKVEEKRIVQIFLYSFLALVTVVTITNIINVVINDINLRLDEFATLKSVGMDKKQFNKMILLEYFSYLGTATILGVLLSLIVIYVIYVFMEDYIFYNLYIPYSEIIIVIALISFILIGIMKYINRKIGRNSIIQFVKRKGI